MRALVVLGLVFTARRYASAVYAMALCLSVTQWLNYSARGGGSLEARGLKGRSTSPKDREQRWGSRPPTIGIRAFEALCLAFMAFK